MLKKLFSIPGCFLLCIVICVLLSVHFHVKGTEMWLISVGIGLFVYGKLAASMLMTQGYGVKHGAKIVFGMPVILFAAFLILGLLAGSFVHSAYQPNHLLAATVANLKVCGWSITTALVVALCHWYAYARSAYFQESEYNVRRELALGGHSESDIDFEIAEYRKRGIIRS